MTSELRVFPLEGLPEIEAGDDLAALLADAAERAGGLLDADVVVVAQKVVSKAEGRVVSLEGIDPSDAGPRAGRRRRPAPPRADPAGERARLSGRARRS